MTLEFLHISETSNSENEHTRELELKREKLMAKKKRLMTKLALAEQAYVSSIRHNTENNLFVRVMGVDEGRVHRELLAGQRLDATPEDRADFPMPAEDWDHHGHLVAIGRRIHNEIGEHGNDRDILQAKLGKCILKMLHNTEKLTGAGVDVLTLDRTLLAQVNVAESVRDSADPVDHMIVDGQQVPVRELQHA